MSVTSANLSEKKKLLGFNLVKTGVITKEQLAVALKEQKKTVHSLGYILIEKNFVSQEKLIKFFETNLGVNYANLQNYLIDKSLVSLVPENIAFQYYVVPLVKMKGILTVALIDPLDDFIVNMLSEITRCEIKALISSKEEILKALNSLYKEQDANQDNSEFSEIQKLTNKLRGIDKDDINSSESPVAKLIDMIIEKALKEGASDIHIEPDQSIIRTRFRIDGILREIMSLSIELAPSISSRVKVMANLDIAEKRVPQDGRAETVYNNKAIDLRISTFPTIHGEKIVMRLLDKTSVLIPLEHLGFEESVLKKFYSVIHKPNGIILLAGPTGSGKTSTLYAAIDKINDSQKNIVTIEDPVEYEIPLINQSQVNVKAGYTFAGGLRSILRQDPDIIMIGEIRDLETAEISIRAALTGHLVFSTIHTNDSPSTITRLIDMGLEPFLISSSLLCIMSQRLIRTICPHCKEKIHEDEAKVQIQRITEGLKKRIPEDFPLYKGVGCEECKNTGYKGRTTINEILLIDDDVRRQIVTNINSVDIKEKARKKGMRTLREDGLLKVLKGITTYEEILRISQLDE
jgi:type IV pilus assembly protein PilB